jgi:hypothetical protein
VAWKMSEVGGQTEGVLGSRKLFTAFNYSLYHNQVYCHITDGNIIGIIVLMQEGRTR